LDWREKPRHVDFLDHLDHTPIVILIPYHSEIMDLRSRQRLTLDIEPFDTSEN
jgi:hypothetical protein